MTRRMTKIATLFAIMVTVATLVAFLAEAGVRSP
jgi:hypothetical protein